MYGTGAYRVTLTLHDAGLAGDCSCPHGQDGFFCKHCVAVGLSVLALGPDLPRRRAATQTKKQTLDTWLESLSREDLLALLRTQIAEDRELRRRLELRAASARQDLGALRAQIRELLDTRRFARYGYIEYEDAHAYAQQVGEAVTAIDEAITAGLATEAVGLAREAIEAITEAYEGIDDSDGSLGDAAHRLADVHLRACQAARFESIGLANYLAEHLLTPDGIIEFDLGDYADLLGTDGMAHIRERVAAAWKRNPRGWHEKYLMENLLRAEGAIDALIDVLAQDLDEHGLGHVHIAQELDAAGRGAEALGWIERGLSESADPHPSLVDDLAGRYRNAGRDQDVLLLRRRRFHTHRALADYQKLRDAAERVDDWPATRTWALGHLRADASATTKTPRATQVWVQPPVLIDALLDDGDIEQAWTAAKGIATEEQWLRLADHVAAISPADALPVYLRQIEPLKKHTGDGIYQQIARLLTSARACHQRLGTMADFDSYTQALRADQKRKRNLMRILDQHGL
ncbi:MAG TPA: SWIM zinc finger family protein [Actinocrinis sp.]|nr:SWIM zinc finger family protein [Actinocrinis sp.]